MKLNPEKTNYWRQQIEAFKASGLSRRDYCDKNQIKLCTLDYWRQQLSATQEQNEPGWIPIKICEDNSSGIDLHVDGITVAIKPGYDKSLLVESETVFSIEALRELLCLIDAIGTRA